MGSCVLHEPVFKAALSCFSQNVGASRGQQSDESRKKVTGHAVRAANSMPNLGRAQNRDTISPARNQKQSSLAGRLPHPSSSSTFPNHQSPSNRVTLPAFTPLELPSLTQHVNAVSPEFLGNYRTNKNLATLRTSQLTQPRDLQSSNEDAPHGRYLARDVQFTAQDGRAASNTSTFDQKQEERRDGRFVQVC